MMVCLLLRLLPLLLPLLLLLPADAARAPPTALVSVDVSVSSDTGDNVGSLLSVAVPGIVIYVLLGAVVAASYARLFWLPPRTEAAAAAAAAAAAQTSIQSESEPLLAVAETQETLLKGGGGGGKQKRGEKRGEKRKRKKKQKEQKKRMMTTDEKGQHRVQKLYHLVAGVFVVLRVLSHSAVLFLGVTGDKYMLLLRRLSVVVDFSMYSLVVYWWVLCYARSFRIAARRVIKRALIGCNGAAYAVTVLLVVLWWIADTGALYEASVWCVITLNLATALVTTAFAVVLYFRQRNEVWFLRGHRDDLVRIIVFSAVFLFCGMLRVFVFLLRPLTGLLVDDWLFYVLGYYIPEVTSTVLQLVVVNYKPLVGGAAEDASLIRSLFTSAHSLIDVADAEALQFASAAAAAASAANGGAGAAVAADDPLAAPPAEDPGLLPVGYATFAAASPGSPVPAGSVSSAAAGTVPAMLRVPQRRGFVLDSSAASSRGSGTGSGMGSSMRQPAASLSLATPGSGPRRPRIDTSLDAAASFFEVDGPARPVQPLGSAATSTAASAASSLAASARYSTGLPP